MQRYDMQVEAKVIVSLAVEAETLADANEKILEALEDDVKRLNATYFKMYPSYFYRPRAKLNGYKVRNYISYVPKDITEESTRKLFDMAWGDTNKEDNTDNEA